MKSAMLFGSPESVHMQRFIKLLLTKADGFEKIVVFSVSESNRMSESDRLFYSANNIEIWCLEPTKFNNRFLKAVTNYFLRRFYLSSKLKKIFKFDFCFIHYCAWQNALWVMATKKYYSKIIPVFWGGDVLRNKYLNSVIYKRFLKYSSDIILPNENSLRVFNNKTFNKYARKSHCIQFPNDVCEKMMTTYKGINKNDARRYFGFSNDKIVVICGHTATRAEQYETMIEQLNKCDKDVLDRCLFVFMMTYAPDNYRIYQHEIKSLLDKTSLNYVILKEFLSESEIVKLHYSADVHLTTIKTDAFSCFLQEELIAENLLIYGKWLNYYEIEDNNIFAISINDFNSIPDVLREVVNNYSKFTQLTKTNREKLMLIVSNESIKKEWKKILKN